jgi:hypothetical protein
MKTTRLLFVLLVFVMGCNTKYQASQQDDTVQTEKDPHTFSKPDKDVVTHLDLAIKVNFDTKQIGTTQTKKTNGI